MKNEYEDFAHNQISYNHKVKIRLQRREKKQYNIWDVINEGCGKEMCEFVDFE